MLTVINFSHPLTPAAAQRLAELAGVRNVDELNIIDIPVQVDLSATLAPQVAAIIVAAITAAGGNRYDIDLFIPPGLSFVAAFIPDSLPGSNMVVIDRIGSPPQFIPSQIVKNWQLLLRSRAAANDNDEANDDDDDE